MVCDYLSVSLVEASALNANGIPWPIDRPNAPRDKVEEKLRLRETFQDVGGADAVIPNQPITRIVDA